MDETNRCGATRANAPDKPCIRPPGHPPHMRLHADIDGETWDDDPVAPIREARKKLLDRLGLNAPTEALAQVEARDTSEAETVILAILVDRLGGKVTITEQEAHEMRAKLARSVLWRLDAYRNPVAMEWIMELHKPMSET